MPKTYKNIYHELKKRQIVVFVSFYRFFRIINPKIMRKIYSVVLLILTSYGCSKQGTVLPSGQVIFYTKIQNPEPIEIYVNGFRLNRTVSETTTDPGKLICYASGNASTSLREGIHNYTAKQKGIEIQGTFEVFAGICNKVEVRFP